METLEQLMLLLEELEKKIEKKDTSAPKILITKRGVGYYIAKR